MHLGVLEVDICPVKGEEFSEAYSCVGEESYGYIYSGVLDVV